MANGKTARAHRNGFATGHGGIDVDRLTADEVLGLLDPDRDGDPLLTPWKRGYRVAIRSAFGH